MTGHVTREVAGVPIAGATVSEIGGTGVAQSGPDGTFRITAAAGEVRLQIRAIGYGRKVVVVGPGETDVTVALAEDPFKLEAVVITGQATTLERRNATTATVKVNGDEANNAPAQSVEQALQGKVAGAVISMNSGAPGGGAQIQIRGITSILGNGAPLFVVDGVIITNDAISVGANTITAAGDNTTPGGIGSNQDALVNRLADLNPDEIESYEVLKSSAATAMYGSRATNGVIIIRTKRGAPGAAPQFNLTSRVGESKPYRLLGTRQFSTVTEVANLPYGNGGGGAVAVMNTLYPNGQIPFTRDYEQEFYNNSAPPYEVTGNFSGGTERTQYFVNLTARDEVGTAPSTGARLYAFRSNVDQSFLDGKVKVNMGFNVTRNSLNRGLSNNDNTNTSPIYDFAYTPGVINLDSVDATGTYVRNPFNGGGNSVSNPFETFHYLTLNELAFRQIGNLNATWSALNAGQHQLSLTVTAGFDRAQVSGNLYSPPFVQYEGGSDGFLGRTVRTEGNIFNYNLQFIGAWAYQPTSTISLTTTGGFDYETQYDRVIRTRARGLLPGVLTTNSGTILDAADNVLGDFRDIALLANEQMVALNERLAVTGGVRADRSSANGDRHKYYLFPRASASYRFPDLGELVNEVKLRAGWGRTGNRPRYGDRDVVLNAGSTISGTPTLVQATVAGNPNVKPETLTEIEGGADVSFVNRRLEFEGTAYSRRITDLLLQPATIPSGGIGAFIVNGGELSNVGFEAALNAVAVQQRDLELNLRATFTKNKQEIKSLPATVSRFPAPGSFGSAYGRNYITPGGRTTWIWGNVPLDSAGNYLPIGTRVTNRAAISATRDTVAGDANPDFVMAFSSSLRWKRLTFAATVDWRKGGAVADMTRNLHDEGGTSRDYDSPINQSTMGDGWALNVPATYTLPNGVTYPYTEGAYRYRAWGGGRDVRAYIESGTYVRVRDISLSYQAPDTWLQTIGARSLRFSFQARNPFVFTNYWSFDPEYNNFGATNLNRFIDLAPYPSARQFYLSVDVGW
ncbi:MAG TPA: SusC/RagA family TonB-linked outer membrane protein [Gemmatimonadales bacterium]|nr:SusC/RagA family TonB-linked outer membrane protein [Gemmatimonadales bacterium]